MKPETRRVPRWWLLFLILALALCTVGVLAQRPYLSRQHYILDLARLTLVTLAALLMWLIAFSRLRWRTRWATLGVTIGGVLVLCALFRIRGVSGNLVPILEPRWSSHSWAPVQTNSLRTVALTIPGAVDFPQFLGADRNAKLSGPRLLTQGLTPEPAPLWRHPVGAGWSGFAVSGSVAVTQEQREGRECVVAYDLLTGRTLWTEGVEARYFTTLAGEGPRATPTLAGGRVFAQGATGHLLCLDLATGRRFWSKDILAENKSDVPSWGQSSSPLVLSNRVLVTAGGKGSPSLLAYRVEDGSLAWSSSASGSTYSSPMEITLAGVPQIVLFADALMGVEPSSGQLLWKHKWPGGHPHVAMPIVAGTNALIVSSGYGTGSGRFQVELGADGKWNARQVWRSNRLKAKFTNLVLHDGHLYGLDDGILACLDAATGELKWKDGKYGHGQILLVADILMIMAESGEIVFVNPQPKELQELGRFRALAGKTWNPPALAGEYLVVRNDLEAACFRLAVRP